MKRGFVEGINRSARRVGVLTLICRMHLEILEVCVKPRDEPFSELVSFLEEPWAAGGR